MTQEADPKLDELRLAYESAVGHEHAEGIAALNRGGRPEAPPLCRELTESAWRELSAYIAGRERERWEAAVRNALPFLSETMTVVDTKSGAAVRYPLDAATAAVSTLRALLQPEQEAEARGDD